MKKFLFKLLLLSVAWFSVMAQKSPARVLVLGLDGFSTEGYYQM